MLLHKHLKQEAGTGTASSEHSIFIKKSYEDWHACLIHPGHPFGALDPADVPGDELCLPDLSHPYTRRASGAGSKRLEGQRDACGLQPRQVKVKLEFHVTLVNYFVVLSKSAFRFFYTHIIFDLKFCIFLCYIPATMELNKIRSFLRAAL